MGKQPQPVAVGDHDLCRSCGARIGDDHLDTPSSVSRRTLAWRASALLRTTLRLTERSAALAVAKKPFESYCRTDTPRSGPIRERIKAARSSKLAPRGAIRSRICGLGMQSAEHHES